MTARSILGWIAALGALGISTSAVAKQQQPECDVTVQQLGTAHVSPYDALRGGEYSDPIRLRLWNKGGQDCAGTLTFYNAFGDSALRRAGGGTLAYTIADEHSRSTVIFDPTANTSQQLAVDVPANKSVEIFPQFVVPGGQAGRAGRYAATLEARFRPTGSLDDELGDVSLAVEVMPSVEANFVGYGNHATLDLGELSTGVKGSIGFQIRASADVDVQVSSASHGQLMHASGVAIPYTMAVDGQPVDLTTQVHRDLDLPDPVRGRTLPINVLVGTVDRAPVGDYRDVVTFRISAK